MSKDAGNLDLGSRESLGRAGFGASEPEQARFTARVVARRTSRPELPTNREVLHVAAGALAAAFAGALVSRGQAPESLAAVGAAVAHAALALRAVLARRRHAREGSPPHPEACYRRPDGALTPVLEPGEEVLLAFDADGPERRGVRVASGFAHVAWGLLLAGLPFAFVPAGASVLALGVAGAACFLGTAVFGRGVRALLATRAVERVAVTSERIVAMAGPGVAQSIPLTALRHRPVVVGRSGGRATVALELRPLASASPLPFMGLYGLHDVDEETAKEIAGVAMDARRALARG